MVQHIIIQKNSSVYLLIEYLDRYHIVAVNNTLDDRTEAKLLAGDCSDEQMDQMRIYRHTILKSKLHGVAIDGCNAGDTIVLYEKNKKHKYTLSDDCTKEELDRLFAGVRRLRTPKNKEEDWRKELQTEEGRKYSRIFGIVLNVVGAAAFFATMLLGQYAWACLAVLLVGTVTYFTWPQYFSAMGSKLYKKAGHTAKVTHLECCIWLPFFALLFGNFHYPSWWPVLIAGAVTGVVVLAVFYLLSREMRENKEFMAIMAIVLIACSFGLVGHINHIANPNKHETVCCVVTGTERHSGRKSTHYKLAVVLPGGEEVEIPVSGKQYYHTQIGDQVQVYTGQGALGIEYTWVEE